MAQWFGTTLISTNYVLADILGQVTAEEIADPDLPEERGGRIQRLIERKSATVPGVAGLSIYGGDCVFRFSVDERLRGFRSNQRFCRDPGVRIGPEAQIQYIPAARSANKRPSILVSRNWIGEDGKVMGGALAAIDLDYAQKWIGGFEVAPRDVLAMVDSDSVLLARNPPLPQAIGTAAPLPQGLTPFGETRGSGGFVVTSPLDGVERIFGISKIEDIPLLLIVGFHKEAALAEWTRRAWQLSLSYVLLCAMSAVLLRAHFIALGQRERMRRLASVDALTGIANRRHLLAIGDEEVERAKRYGRPFSVLMLDIDRFKAINDTYGHSTGDRVIQSLAVVAGAAIRECDVPGRLGGEEFAIVLPETSGDHAAALAERLRHAIAEASEVRSEDGESIRFTASIGVAALTPEDAGFSGLLGRADKALYAAKAGGRNRVVLAAA
ncbi:MAG: GGDEF domain-containing protein [Alphaproteobacteria bacterium]|nr:GGDEF domain-containing protein [Alphaproteobacteria bacterium]